MIFIEFQEMPLFADFDKSFIIGRNAWFPFKINADNDYQLCFNTGFIVFELIEFKEVTLKTPLISFYSKTATK